MKQLHIPTPEQLELKEELLKQIQHLAYIANIEKSVENRRSMQAAQLVPDTNDVLTTIQTTTIGERTFLYISIALSLLVAEKLGYEVK